MNLMVPAMEIMSIGNELLIGKICNTNAQWLCKKATALGVAVKRVTMLPDNIDETAVAIRETLNRSPQFVITTGGLGPTFDDKTLETIAKALGRKIEINEEALKMVKAKYQAYVANMGSQDFELTEARVKMASFPEGSTPIRNPVGTAPGMQVELKDTTLLALPGVPHEMEAIFDETIMPQLRKASNGAAFYDENLYVDIMESSLAPLIEIVMQESPGIYIKSHPQGEERQPHIELHFSTTSSNAMEAQERLRKAVAKLADLIRSNNGRVYSKEHNSNQG